MKFNDYPLKDELGEGLHMYERTTGRSAHILVESIIEKYLIKTGILGSDDEEIVDFPYDLIPTEEETTPVNKNKFKKKSSGKYDKVYYEDLYFGHHSKQNSDELIIKLSEQPYSRLVELSKNNVGDVVKYPSFLRKALENSSYTIEKHKKLFRRRITVNPTENNKRQVRINNFSLGAFEDEDNVEKIVDCVYKMSDSEIEELIEGLQNFKGNRRKYTLKFVREWKET